MILAPLVETESLLIYLTISRQVTISAFLLIQYEPFKAASKTSLSERAKSKGLLEPAEQILYGRGVVKLNDFVNAANGLDDVQSVRDGLKHIILTIINKDVDVLEEIRRL